MKLSVNGVVKIIPDNGGVDLLDTETNEWQEPFVR